MFKTLLKKANCLCALDHCGGGFASTKATSEEVRKI